jgi:hypothetical protein
MVSLAKFSSLAWLQPHFHGFFEILLLRGALHTLGTSGHIVIIFVHAGCGRAVSACLVGLVHGVLKFEVLDHRVGGGSVLRNTGREDLLQEVQVLELVLLRELDVELDVEVTVVVVTERGHTLAVNNLNGV